MLIFAEKSLSEIAPFVSEIFAPIEVPALSNYETVAKHQTLR
jgi:hypothetical protein